MLETLVRQYAKTERVTEALKRTDQLEWVHRMKNISDRAEEIVLLGRTRSSLGNPFHRSDKRHSKSVITEKVVS